MKKIVNLFKTIFLIAPFGLAISCTTSNIKNDTVIQNQFINIKLSNYDREIKNNAQLMPKEIYNKQVDYMKDHSKVFTLAIIYNDNVDIKHINVVDNKNLWFYMSSLNEIIFKTYDVPIYGRWVGPFFKKDSQDQLIYGTSKNSNYGMHGYPLFFYNHMFATLGASGYIPHAQEIIEVTYNHES